MSDVNIYLNIAGGCVVAVGCMVCCALNWDDPPDWCPNWIQPEWKRDETVSKYKHEITINTLKKPEIIVNNYKSNETREWEIV